MPSMIDLLELDPDPRTRAQAARELGKSLDVNTWNTLQRAWMFDPSAEVRASAGKAIQTLWGGRTPILAKRLK